MIHYLAYHYMKLIRVQSSDGLADVNMVRSRKVRNFQEINDLPEDSEDLFHASWIDTYYPNRPADLEILTCMTF